MGVHARLPVQKPHINLLQKRLAIAFVASDVIRLSQIVRALIEGRHPGQVVRLAFRVELPIFHLVGATGIFRVWPPIWTQTLKIMLIARPCESLIRHRHGLTPYRSLSLLQNISALCMLRILAHLLQFAHVPQPWLGVEQKGKAEKEE